MVVAAFDDSGCCAVPQKTLLQLAPGGELGHSHTFSNPNVGEINSKQIFGNTADLST